MTEALVGGHAGQVLPDVDDVKLRCLRFEEWPALDRQTWTASTTPADAFDDPRPADHLQPASVLNYQQGYGRWLTFLADCGELDPNAVPIARVTRRLLWAYLLELRQRGNAPATIIGRFGALHMALRILAPDTDMAWIKRPRGRSVHTLLSKHRRRLLVPDSGVLAQWAYDVMATARQDIGASSNQVAFRNGLLLGLLAARARRIRAMAGLRVGQELVFCNGGFEIDLTEDLVKTKREDWFPLPGYLTSPMQLYLDVVRPRLLGGQQNDRLWISIKGTPLRQGSLQNMVLEYTKERFGTAFGPHRFRHAVATTSALRASDQPHLAAGVLNITSKVANRHYNRAMHVQASLAYEALLMRRMQELGIS